MSLSDVQLFGISIDYQADRNAARERATSEQRFAEEHREAARGAPAPTRDPRLMKGKSA